jgi:hypothetical protein
MIVSVTIARASVIPRALVRPPLPALATPTLALVPKHESRTEVPTSRSANTLALGSWLDWLSPPIVAMFSSRGFIRTTCLFLSRFLCLRFLFISYFGFPWTEQGAFWHLLIQEFRAICDSLGKKNNSGIFGIRH